MNNGEIFKKHIYLLEKVNEATKEQSYSLHLQKLYGFREALYILGINQLMECDLYYLDQGIDRPMCCGVFLDKEYGS